MNLLMSRVKIVKSVREEVLLIRIHKTSQKESIYVKDVEDIKAVKQGSSMSKILSSTYILTMRFCRSLFKLEG